MPVDFSDYTLHSNQKGYQTVADQVARFIAP